MRRTTMAIGAAIAAVAISTSGAAVAEAAPAAKKIATVASHHCENLGLTIILTPAQKARAQAVLPSGFRLTDGPTLLVETSQCAGAKVNGRNIGRFKLSEAALSIVPPRKAQSRQLPNIVTENIFMLSQLDTSRVLSELKAGAGYPTELTDISLDRGKSSAVPRVMWASASGNLAPTSVRAETSPFLLPPGVDVPNPGVVYQLWAKNSDGKYVVTTNSNLRIGTPAAGTGVLTVEKGTLLHQVLGSRTASGVAFSGSASGFVNDTYVFTR
ncbi:hypothetical protein [Gordonia sp. (in: high G+C Gram-positive bacteria)]|uniref:hypothetical protein n=1 Tax=Gordonia sp. (in: high G+C Gram-positive bacteria) TaxID=84139 RepID=UPI003C796EB3